MREMEKEMQIAQDQISARREEQERSTQGVRRFESLKIISYSASPCLESGTGGQEEQAACKNTAPMISAELSFETFV